MAVTVMEVLKRLPRTNCGDCGQATCLAFATRVIKEGEDLGKCPHLTAGDEFSQLIRSQQQAGVGRRRESVAISLEVLQEKVAPLDLKALAAGLGADYGEEAGRPYLAMPYFGYCLQVFKDELRYPPGALADPWDAILLYNYIASGGSRVPAGDWIAYNSLPNSVSKAKTLARLERELAAHFSGRASDLKDRAANWGPNWSRWAAKTPTSRPSSGRCPGSPCCCSSGTPTWRKASRPSAASSSMPASPTTWTWRPCSFWWSTCWRG